MSIILAGDRFLLYDQTVNSKRLIIFASDVELQVLSNSNFILIDGTFDICPAPFTQLLSVHAEVFFSFLSNSAIQIDQKVFRPCAFALLMSKEQKEYERFFTILKNHPLMQHFDPTDVATGL